MTYPLLQRLLAPLATICIVGLVVALCSWFLAGAVGLQVSLAALGVTLLIAASSEGLVNLARVTDPVQRMFGTMFIRGLGAALSLLAGIASGCEVKMLALIALPMYLSLIAAEVIDALRSLAENKSNNNDTPTALSI